MKPEPHHKAANGGGHADDAAPSSAGRDALSHALDYIARGWSPVPVKFKDKAPIGGKGWQNIHVTQDNAHEHFRGQMNVGVAFGERSNGLTDLDLDCVEAIAIAPHLLPATDARFGRRSKPASHLLYYTDLAKTIEKAAIQFKDPEDKTVLLEVRIGGGNKAAQTVFPGSTHPSGESVEWQQNGAGEPSRIDGQELLQAAKMTAAACALARHWPEIGGRHDAYLGLGGFLSRAGFELEDALTFGLAVIETIDDADIDHMERCVRDGWMSYQEDKEAYGYPHLVETFGEKVAKAVAEWLGFSTRGERTVPPGDRFPPPSNGEGSKPKITITANFDANLIACVNALIDSPHVEIFQRGGALVMRGTIKSKSHTGAEINDDAIIAHCAESLRYALATAADFYRWDGRVKGSDKRVKCCPPQELAAALVKCAPLIGRFPVLRGLTSIPTIRADGSILATSGYDPATGLYYDPKGIDYGAMPHDATMEDAETAVQELEALIREFPFVDEASRSVALARILTGVARNAMKVAMMFAYTAPSPRTGKSKLNDIGTMITDGHEAPVMGATSSPEEIEKRLVAALRGGSQTITLDNLPNGEVLESELICQMLTQERVEVRPFHSNDKNIILPNTATVVVNGNNIGFAADITERMNLCQLDAKMEFPGMRKFDFDPVEMVRANRVKYVRDCLTILRAHALAGYPKSEELSAIGGFEGWSKIIRAALVWLGRGDPCDSMNVIRAEDPQKRSLLEIMDHWKAAFDKSGKTAAEVIKHAEDMARPEFNDDGRGGRELVHQGDGAFLAAISEVAALEKGGRINASSFGKWLKSKEGVVIGDRRFYSLPQGKHKGSGKIYCLLSLKDEMHIRASINVEAMNDDDDVSDDDVPM